MNARIERRLLLNWRADPEVVTPLVPAHFRPLLVDGSAVVGICFVRLGSLRPRGVPQRFALRSESAAHRIAVERDGPDGGEPGVFILRRVTDSRLARLAGGRVFPGVHSAARFDVHETTADLDLSFATPEGLFDAAVSGTVAKTLKSRLFDDLDHLSSFFRNAPIGWSPSRRSGRLDGVELVTEGWSMAPVDIKTASSAFFDDSRRFPPGSIELDSAAVMTDLAVRWRAAGAHGPSAGGRCH